MTVALSSNLPRKSNILQPTPYQGSMTMASQNLTLLKRMVMGMGIAFFKPLPDKDVTSIDAMPFDPNTDTMHPHIELELREFQ